MADPLEQWEAARLIDRHHAYGHREQKIADAGDALAEALRAEREAHQSQQREAIRQMDRGNKAKAKLATERNSNADLSEALDEAIRERDAHEERADKAEAENKRLRNALVKIADLSHPSAPDRPANIAYEALTGVQPHREKEAGC